MHKGLSKKKGLRDKFLPGSEAPGVSGDWIQELWMPGLENCSLGPVGRGCRWRAFGLVAS